MNTCEYCECEQTEDLIWDDYLEAWICQVHIDLVENHTGYCSVECQLGWGCDETC